MSRFRRVILVTSALSALALSCQVLIGIRDDDLSVAEPAEDKDATPPKPPPCAPELLAPPPKVTGGAEGTYFFGLETVKLGGQSRGDGFNLDYACTCGDKPDAETRGNCRRPPDAFDASTPEACDTDGGVDNAFFQFTESYASATVDALNKGIAKSYACGRENLIFVLQKYNGLADDEDVLLVAVRSHGILEDPSDAGHAGCGDFYPARFDGTDRWAIDPTLVGAGGIAKPVSIKGFVSGYKLVADGRSGTAKGFEIPGLGRPAPSLNRPVLVANIKVTAGLVEMTDGVMSGRADMKELLRSMGEQLPDGPDGQPYCANSSWNLVKDTLCSAVDVMSNKDREFSSDICDALSLVLSFTAKPVQYDIRPDTATLTRRCDDAKLHCSWVP